MPVPTATPLCEPRSRRSLPRRPARRNDALNRAAFSLFQLVAGGELAEAEVIAALQQACVANGLAADDGWQSVHATIRSGRGAGLQHPRSRGAP